jgi:hypothetical protein
MKAKVLNWVHLRARIQLQHIVQIPPHVKTKISGGLRRRASKVGELRGNDKIHKVQEHLMLPAASRLSAPKANQCEYQMY